MMKIIIALESTLMMILLMWSKGFCMAKKETKKEEEKSAFDLEAELEAYPLPDWYKTAFTLTVDTSNIKNKSDLDKAFEKYGAMK